jgi:hypothetical protein
MRRSSYGSGHATTPLPHDGSSSSTASSDFFSPISIAYFQNHKQETTPLGTSTSMRLPPSHDSSWIGARLSPIHSFDREEADDSDHDENEDEPKPQSHQKVNRRIWNDASSSSKKMPTASKNPAREEPMNAGLGSSSTNEMNPFSSPPLVPNDVPLPRRTSTDSMAAVGVTVCVLSGIHFFVFMGLYDIFLSDHGEGWMWPYGIPSETTLLRWGALSPSFMDEEEFSSSSSIWYHHRKYFISFLSSLIACTSLVEWLLIVLAWRMLYISSTRQYALKQELRPPDVRYTWYQLGSIYVLAAFVGQLWMRTYDLHFVAVGCVSWGTCGVLCIMGMSVPMYRFELFVTAASLLMLSLLLRPYSSVHGTAGSAFFGWALGALIYVEPHPLQDRHVMYVGNRNDVKGMKAVTLIGTAGTVIVVSLPVLSLAFRT